MDKSLKYKPFKGIVVSFQKKYSNKYLDILSKFVDKYEIIIKKKNLDFNKYRQIISKYSKLVVKHLKKPPKFEYFHKAIRSPIDYYQIGLDLFRPLIDFENSTLSGIENICQMQAHIKKNENIILFANHQIEADPQAISLLLENSFHDFATKMIFIAGERVITDGLAIPISLGVNLFCIYSKKYFDVHKDKKDKMTNHNKETILTIKKKLKKGGQCIYIAPSGGRDRMNKDGVVEVAPFDHQSIELFYILGKNSKVQTHFYPLALSTHDIMPPPDGIQIDLGEIRHTDEAPIHLSFGKELNMENFPGSDTTCRDLKKKLRRDYIYNIVCSMYNKFPN